MSGSWDVSPPTRHARISRYSSAQPPCSSERGHRSRCGCTPTASPTPGTSASSVSISGSRGRKSVCPSRTPRSPMSSLPHATGRVTSRWGWGSERGSATPWSSHLPVGRRSSTERLPAGWNSSLAETGWSTRWPGGSNPATRSSGQSSGQKIWRGRLRSPQPGNEVILPSVQPTAGGRSATSRGTSSGHDGEHGFGTG